MENLIPSDDEDELVSKLDGELNLSDLITNKSTCFKIAPNTNNFEQQESNFINHEATIDSINLDCLNFDDEDDDDPTNLGKTPFQILGSKMVNMTENGFIKKKVKRCGFGDVVSDEACVTVQYNSFLEYHDEPYDSTYLRGRPQKINLKDGEVLPGLAMAIQSMKKNEISLFLIHPNLGYGKLGCPPRIPPDSQLLFHIELIDIINIDSVEKLNLPVGDIKKLTFEEIYTMSKDLNSLANGFFTRHNKVLAIKKYRKALEILNGVNLASEEEEEKYKKLIVKLYNNLAVCYNLQSRPGLACSMSRQALYYDRNSIKAYYNHAKALISLGDFPVAKNFLKKAHNLDPHNKDVNTLLNKLESEQTKYKKDSQNFARNIFGNFNKTPKAEAAAAPDNKDVDWFPDQENEFDNCLMNFLTQNLQDLREGEKMVLPLGLTYEEIQIIKGKVTELNLTISTSEEDSSSIIISKE